MNENSYYRNALRILFILLKGSTPLLASDSNEAVAIFKGEARLYAFDFWMRYPDYLAEELVDLFERTKEVGYLEAAEEIFASDEPDIRRFPMIRYRFGAYESLDDILALLRSRDLVRITGIKSADKVRETDFLLMPTAFTLAKNIISDYPVLGWYERRASLVAEVAAGRGGSALKKRQYEQAEYAETEMGGIIPSISNRVKDRLLALKLEV